MKENRKKQYIVVTHVIKKENDQYVATCPEFDVSSFGKTVEEANENLKEALLLYLEGIEELNLRDQIFKEKSIVVPNTPKDLPLGTLSSIRKQLKLSKEEFINLLS
jgi:predicted RNase H-like HicB family nuclease